MLYRICTEDINQGKIEKIVSKSYPGFTIIKGEGFWESQKEESLIIEIVTGNDDGIINDIANKIKKVNNQDAILVQKIVDHNWFI